ncbi:MAG: thiamine-phosphate kinase [bacterium]|nr:thiamine-phosphate kinase [bacterium]
MTKLSGEFELIKHIAARAVRKEVICGIGDDAAVIKYGNKFLLLTTDTIVEHDHFSFSYFTPEQIGIKAIESNFSDIAAMGGVPLYVLVSLVLKSDSTMHMVEEIYKGMRNRCKKHNVDIIGGDTTHGNANVITITLIGETDKKHLCMRKDAKSGDLIFVTGLLGASTAGLHLFRKGINGFKVTKRCHTTPQSRLDVSWEIAGYANAMEDISDGLASELRNISEQSKCGAIIYADKVPIDKQTYMAAQACGESALDFALYGGEDFELVYTVSKERSKKAYGYCVGEITKGKGIYLKKDNRLTKLTKFGYDHFKKQ